MIHSTLLPSLHELRAASASLSSRLEQHHSEVSSIRAETLRSFHSAQSERLSRVQRLNRSVGARRTQLKDAMSTLARIEEFIQLFGGSGGGGDGDGVGGDGGHGVGVGASDPTASCRSPAAICSFLTLAPSLLEQARTIAMSETLSKRTSEHTGIGGVSAGADGLSAGNVYDSTPTPGDTFSTKMTDSLVHEMDELAAQIMHERKEKEEKIQALPSLHTLLSTKDADLDALLASRRGLLVEAGRQAEEMQLLYSKAHHEIEEWSNLSDELSHHLASFQAACIHCGVALSASAANTPCMRAPPTTAAHAAPMGVRLHQFVSSTNGIGLDRSRRMP